MSDRLTAWLCWIGWHRWRVVTFRTAGVFYRCAWCSEIKPHPWGVSSRT